MAFTRRSFLKATTASGIAALPLTSSRFQASAQSVVGPDATIMSSATTTHYISMANSYKSLPTAQSWRNIAAAHRMVRNDVAAKNLDARLKGAAARTNPASVTLDNIVRQFFQPTYQGITNYQPTVQQSDLEDLFTQSSWDSATVQSAFTMIQQGGMTGVLDQAIGQADTIANAIGPGGNGPREGAVTSSNLQARGGEKGSAPASSGMRPLDDFSYGWADEIYAGGNRGGGGYNCQTDGITIAFLGIAFAVFAVLDWEDAVEYEAWKYLANFGAVAIPTWASGHEMFC